MIYQNVQFFIWNNTGFFECYLRENILYAVLLARVIIIAIFNIHQQ